MIVLVLSMTIQLCLFFILATVSLWLDQLLNSSIGDRVDFHTLYKTTSIITLVVSQIDVFECATFHINVYAVARPLVDDGMSLSFMQPK